MKNPLLERRLPFFNTTFIFFLLLIIPFVSFSQNHKKIGTVSSFVSSISKQKRSGKSEKIFLTTDSSYSGFFNFISSEGQKNKAIGTLKDYPKSNIYFNIENEKLDGKAIIPEIEKAYEYYSDQLGDVYVKEVAIDKVICINYGEPVNSLINTNTSTAISAPALNLQSSPGAQGVILLDFDGQYISGTYWNGGNPIDALPCALSESEIIEVWKLVSEDYRPFNINITTSESVYQAAPLDKRMRCIFTPTTTASPGAGGIAYIGSFTWGTDTPCWVFNDGIKGAGEAASHEIGHTLGLSHDGRISAQEEYFSGTEEWAPIMGIGYYSKIVQWSKGEYADASNQQDDIAIISSGVANLGFRIDEAGTITGSFKQLVYTDAGEVNADQNSGVITSAEDEDIYYFTTSGGSTNLLINPSSSNPNLDINASITDGEGKIVAFSSPLDSLSSKLTVNLNAGTYYLHIKGSGKISLTTIDYSEYGSIGEYFISGIINFTPTINKAPSVSLLIPANGSIFLAPSIELIADAIDTDGKVVKVEFYTGKTKIGEDTIAPFSLTWKTATAGIIKLTAKATDNKGTYTISSEVSISIKNPIATIYQHCSYQLTGYAIGLDTGRYTTERLLSLGIKDKDISGAKITAGYEITLYQNNNFTGSSITLRVNDNCLYDNKLNDSISSLIIREIPNIPPSIVITSPKSGTVITEGSDLTITAEATDSDGQVSVVNFYKERENLFASTTAPYTYTISKIAAGTYNFKAIVTDNKGASVSSEVITINVVSPELPVGINGPSCIEAGLTYIYTFKNDQPTTNISWWTISDAKIIRDGSDYKKVNVNFSQYNNTSVSLYAGVSYVIAPFYKEYSKLILLGNCPDNKRTAVNSAPHPFISTTNISVDNGDNILSVKICDLQGKEVYSSGPLNSEAIEVGENLSQGLYILHITTLNGSYTRTILKN
ncbi:MAG: T9SS type A sorting domain-containing protein [Sporocytophaga sp.]|uniref:Ig-like domain-containing protein n=1 Tax=Sporocytophaga sp. TaxID=2231183 RepID=UPI001B1C2E51|nr:Ig-like domain-containing protein [Sporocytophaga sp.]MBO9700803.1 T9SS type A sorting domain-containing protein [Sporocytophaga sp.]